VLMAVKTSRCFKAGSLNSSRRKNNSFAFIPLL
jgi:hypothetical protein